jgi:hypothetical protein
MSLARSRFLSRTLTCPGSERRAGRRYA